MDWQNTYYYSPVAGANHGVRPIVNLRADVGLVASGSAYNIVALNNE